MLFALFLLCLMTGTLPRIVLPYNLTIHALQSLIGNG